MKRRRVISSNILSVGYDPKVSVLEIEFHQGRVYRFKGVPKGKYRGILRAKSKGKYFNRRIRNEFPYEEVT